MAMSKADKLAQVHSEAMRQFDCIQSALRDERLQCLQDRRFYSISGAQWEGDLADQFANKPKFEVNKIHLAVIRIINEYRNNRITVDFVAKDGSKDDQLADTCDGLYRADEKDSCAEEAYDNAFEEAIGGGFGAYRLRACYEDEEDDENEYQRIRIEPIFDADSSVFFDLQAKRQDKADAKHCFVLTSMTPDAYKDEYEDDPTSWPKEIQQHEFDWFTPDVVYVSEYYRVEEVASIVHIFERIDGEEERYSDEELTDDDGKLLATLAAVGTKKVREKKVKRRKIHKYIMSGGKVLDDCGYIAGKHIPIVPVYGKRWFVDNIERCMGHVRLAKDAQRLKNMQLSKLGEISALSSVEKPIVTPEQVAGHEMMWSQDNVKNYPYLLINPITDLAGNPMPASPVAYTRAPQIPPAMAALLQITEQDMSDILGNQQNADEMVSNISGKAVEMIQQRLDMQAFIYMSNMAKAVRRGGEIWLSMAKELYTDEGRKMKLVGSMDQTDTVELGKVRLVDGVPVKQDDMSAASYDVMVDVGPSSASRRSATVRALTGMMAITNDPETSQVLQSMAMMNMEGEGISDAREFFRQRLVKMGVVKPTEEEAQIMAANPPPPDANQTYLKAAAEEATAKAAQARAQTVKTIADSELAHAKTLETLSSIDMAEQEQVIKNAQVLSQGLLQIGIRPAEEQGELAQGF
jgi:hypothetical protein